MLKTNQGGAWVLPHIEELRRRGHHVVVILPAGPGRLRLRLDDLSVPVREAAVNFGLAPRPALLVGLWRLRRQIAAEQPDVVHYHLFASALAARLATTGMRCIRVHMVAGPLYLDSRIIRAVERILSRWDTHLVAGSLHTRARYLALGFPDRKMSVTAYGADTDHFRPATAEERAAARSRLGLTDDEFVAVMVAYVYGPKAAVHRGLGIKGHDVLLRAWKELQASEPGGRLLLVGGGFDAAGEAHRRALMQSVDVDESITWLDSIDDVRVVYAAADVSVSPSLSENHGAAVEAGACGIPSIVSDAGGLPETVDADSGWTVPRGDVTALRLALASARAQHPPIRQRRGEAARFRVVRLFDSRRGAGRLADTIEGLVAGPTLRVSIVSEARLTGNGKVGWCSTDAVNGDEQWQRYRHRFVGARVAARADASTVTAGTAMTTPVYPLPHYVGIFGMMRTLPRLITAIVDLVRGSDVLILRAPGPLSVIAWVVARLARKPIAVELVGDAYEALGAAGMGPVAAAIGARVTRRVVAGSSAVRYVTNSALQKAYPAGMGAVTAVASNVRLPSESFAAQARSVAAPLRCARLLAIGSQQNAHKGHDVLIEALRLLRGRGVAVTARIVGDGALRPGLERSAEESGLSEVLTFLAAGQSRAALRELMGNSDVLVHPSRTEGLPRVVIEAMAQALPVVASHVGGIPELLEEAMLCPPDVPEALADVVAALINDPEALSAASSANLQMARSFAQEELDHRFALWLDAVARLARSDR